MALLIELLHSLGVEWGSDRCETTIAAKSTSFARLAGDPEKGVSGGRMAHSLRSMGSAACNYAMVAQGGLDMYWWVPFDRFWPYPLLTKLQGNRVLAMGCMCRHCDCRGGGRSGDWIS